MNREKKAITMVVGIVKQKLKQFASSIDDSTTSPDSTVGSGRGPAADKSRPASESATVVTDVAEAEAPV